MGERVLECLRCNSKMNYLKTEKIQLGDSISNLIAGSIKLDIYSCPNCGKVEFFQPTDEINNLEHFDDEIEQTQCPQCGKMHDIDYPKCPYCKYVYPED
jgi:hypothetical protein